MCENTSSKYTVVVFQGDNVSSAISEVKKRGGCEVFKITSFDDMVSFLKKTDFFSLRFAVNSDRIAFDTFLNSIDQQKSSIEFDDPASQIQRSYKRAPKTIHDMEKQHIIKTLHLCKWKYKSAAQVLGINRTTLYRKIKKYNISPTHKK